MPRLVLLLGVLFAATALAHDAGHATYEVSQAVVVHFSGHDDESAEGWAYTVLDPQGEAFARGMCDIRGRVVFMPDRAGAWKVRAYSPDGHGATLDVAVDENLAAGVQAPASAQQPWVKWIVVVVAALAVLRFVTHLRR